VYKRQVPQEEEEVELLSREQLSVIGASSQYGPSHLPIPQRSHECHGCVQALTLPFGLPSEMQL